MPAKQRVHQWAPGVGGAAGAAGALSASRPSPAGRAAPTHCQASVSKELRTGFVAARRLVCDSVLQNPLWGA